MAMCLGFLTYLQKRRPTEPFTLEDKGRLKRFVQMHSTLRHQISKNILDAANSWRRQEMIKASLVSQVPLIVASAESHLGRAAVTA